MGNQKIIEEREEFLSLVDYILEKNHEKYSQYGKWERPHLKTYLIESNTASPLDIKNEIEDGFIIKNTQAEDFFRVVTEDFKNGGFIDTSKDRIWKFHSLLKSSDSDKFMEKWVDKKKYLDRCWHTNDQLKNIEEKFNFRGLGIQFEDYFEEDDIEKSERRKTSLKIWTRGEGKLFEHEKELYNVAEKYFSRNSLRIQGLDEDNKSQFLNEMYYDGKITTTYAKSPYQVVNKFPNNLIKNYLEILGKIENKRGVLGGPIELKFDGDIPIQRMTEFFKSGKLPFRLWLTPIEEKDDFVRMYGVDLHTGDNIGLDIGKNHIWINIPKGTCGNAGLRIPTLLGFAFPYNIDVLLEGDDLID